MNRMFVDFFKRVMSFLMFVCIAQCYTFAIEGNKIIYGTPDNECINYADQNGVTSTIIDGNGIYWIREIFEDINSSSKKLNLKHLWYGIDNSNGSFEVGSVFHIKVLSKNENDYIEQYSNVDNNIKNDIKNEQGIIFDIGVTDPNGKEYHNFKSTNLYIQKFESWDKNLNFVFISKNQDEDKFEESLVRMRSPLKEDLDFVKVSIEHFSPYMIYEKVIDKNYNINSKNAIDNKINAINFKETNDNKIAILLITSYLIYLVFIYKTKKGNK